jgi:hypothetical protein
VSKRNAPCVIVETLPFDAPAGHTEYHRNSAGEIVGLQFGCPCGCGAHYGGRFRGEDAWGFDGNVEKPTVTGSFGCGVGQSFGVRYHWHGYLKNGLFEEC